MKYVFFLDIGFLDRIEGSNIDNINIFICVYIYITEFRVDKIIKLFTYIQIYILQKSVCITQISLFLSVDRIVRCKK